MPTSSTQSTEVPVPDDVLERIPDIPAGEQEPGEPSKATYALAVHVFEQILTTGAGEVTAVMAAVDHVSVALLKQGAEEAERERDKWAVIAGIGMRIAAAAQSLLATVHPADGKSDPATVSRASITALQSALRDAEPEQRTPLDAARRRGAEEERERLKRALTSQPALAAARASLEDAGAKYGRVWGSDVGDAFRAAFAALTDNQEPS